MMQDHPTTIKCVIVDDEEMATKVIVTHLAHIPDFEIVGIYHSAVDAFLALDNIEVDVLFLDIQMPKVTGIEMIKMLKKRPLTVLTTAHREYALDGFELEVVDYLMKPVGLQRFLQTISRLKKQLYITNEARGELSIEEKEPNNGNDENKVALKHTFIKTNRAFQKIDFDTMLHIEAIKNHIKIVTNDKTYISLVQLSEFEKQLPKAFLRVHRSFIVNTTHIVRFDNNCIQNQKAEIPIGRTYKEKIILILKELIDG